MNRIITWLQSTTVRVLITIFFVTLTFAVSMAFSPDSSLRVQAQTLTPEATEYQIDSPDSPFQPESEAIKNEGEYAGKDLVEGAKEKTESAADNVREKLNLDQPIYPGTKKFINQVKDKVEETLPGE
jgi:ABC-type dipeptide/oligopeptide/nickel transport system permease component